MVYKHSWLLYADHQLVKIEDDKWVAEKPAQHDTFVERIAAAWEVLRGRADAFYWYR